MQVSLRDYIDLIESAEQHAETRVSVQVRNYETNPAQSIHASEVARSFIITFDGDIPDDELEQTVRDEVLKITGFKPAKLTWNRVD